VNNPCDSEIIAYIVNAARRKLNKPFKKNEPVTSDIMIKLFAKYNTVDRTLQDVRLLTLCSLAYTVLLRYNELCNIKAKHCQRLNQFVLLLSN
jgi:hypothetical protein